MSSHLVEMFRRCAKFFKVASEADVKAMTKGAEIPMDVQLPMRHLTKEQLYERFLLTRWWDNKSVAKKPSAKTPQAMAAAVSEKKMPSGFKFRPASPTTLFLAENKGCEVFKQLSARKCSPLAAWARLSEDQKEIWRRRAEVHPGFAAKLPKPTRARRKGMTAFQVFAEELSRDPRFLSLPTRLRFRVIGILWKAQKSKIEELQNQLIKEGKMNPAAALGSTRRKPTGRPAFRFKSYDALGISTLKSKSPRAMKQRKMKKAFA